MIGEKVAEAIPCVSFKERCEVVRKLDEAGIVPQVVGNVALICYQNKYNTKGNINV